MGPRTDEGKAISAKNSTRLGFRSREYRLLWKEFNEASRQLRMIELNNSENFSENHDERTNQKISEILQNGLTFTIEHPPYTSPDGTVTKETETITMPPPRWLIEAILDGKI